MLKYPVDIHITPCNMLRQKQFLWTNTAPKTQSLGNFWNCFVWSAVFSGELLFIFEEDKK